jgi:signal transduction histidine kinase/ligand-binding sensor domain-containing protein
MSAFAEPVHGRLPLQHYSASEGLVNDSVMSIQTDSRGFVWLGTLDGISRFDGAHFVNYTTAHGLPDRMVWSIVEDRDGSMWAATSGGTARMNASATKGPKLFTPIEAGPGVTPGGSALFVDAAGTMWAGCDHDLCSIRNGRLELDPSLREAGGFDVTAMRERPDGTFWVATGNGIFVRPRGGAWRRIVVHPTAPRTDGVGGLLFDGDGLLWLSTGFGIIVFNPAGGSLPTRPLRDIVGKPLLAGDPLRLPGPGEAVMITVPGDTPIICRQPFRSSDGAIWQPCYGGLFRIEDGRIDYYDERDGLPLDLTSIGEDPEGEIWIGTRNDAALRLVRSGARTYDRKHGLANERIMSVFALDDETVCATNRLGLSCIRGDEIHHGSLWPPGMRYLGWGWNQIVARDQAGSLWFATGEGLVRWPRVKAIEDLGRVAPLAVYTTRDGLDLNEVFRVWIDSHDEVWVSTFGKNPLSRANAKTGRFTSFGAELGATPTAFAEDRAGNVWLGFYTGGVARFRDGRFERLSRGIPTGFVRDLTVDSHGSLWIAATGGVARIEDPTAGLDRLSIQRFSRKDGLSSDSGYSVVELKDGRIGISSQRGFDVFDLQRRTVVPITVQEGLASNEVTVSLTTPDGALWLGTARGLSHLPSVPRRRISPPPQPRFHSVAIDGIALPVAELGAASLPRIRVEYPRHAVAINFSAPQHDRTRALSFAYRIAGEEGWTNAGSEETLVFDRLPSGRGSLELRTVTSDGRASQPAVMAFEVIPPLWKRTWFLALAALLLVATAVLAHRARVAQMVALERVRTRVATDLHDDLGSSLSRISILSEAAKRKEALSQAAPILDEIADSARSLIDALGDTIWSIDPRNDDVRSVVVRAQDFAAALFEAQDTAVDVTVPDPVARIPLRAEQRREIFLILKEALNNTARHAAARRVNIEAGVDAGSLRITVKDDGKGFGSREPSRDGGRGVPSMSDRAARAGGRLHIESEPGGGARVSIVLPVSS